MTNRDNLAMKIGIILVLFLLLLTLVFSALKPMPQEYDIAFAEDNPEPVLVTAFAEPLDSCQDFTWSLIWDQEKTGSVAYWAVKDKDPLEYIGLEIDGANCTVSFKKYYKVIITVTVYLTLTATSVENEEMFATCSIKLG